MLVNAIGGRSGNSATKCSFPPIASTYPLSVDSSRSLRCFDARHVFLVDPELLCYPSLCLISCLAQIAKSHLFRDQCIGQLLDSLPAIFGKSVYFCL